MSGDRSNHGDGLSFGFTWDPMDRRHATVFLVTPEATIEALMTVEQLDDCAEAFRSVAAAVRAGRKTTQ